MQIGRRSAGHARLTTLRSATALGLVVSLFGLLAFATPAPVGAAPTDVRYVSASTQVGSQVRRHVACPPGTKVTGGGVHISGAGKAHLLSVAGSAPWDGPDADTRPADGWVAVANNEGLAPRTMAVYAVCAASGSYSYPSKQTNLTGPGQIGESANCPPGSLVTGGGISFSGNGTYNKVNAIYPEDGPDAGMRADDTWRAYGINEIPGYTEVMTVHAVCASSKTFKYVSLPALTILPVGTQKSEEVGCPAGTSVVGGGVFNSGGGTDDVVVSSEPYDGPDADLERDDGWRGYAANGEGSSSFMNVYAECATSGSFSRVSSKTTVGVRQSLRAKCPAGTEVTGGGVHLTHAESSPFDKVNSNEPFDGPDADTRRDDGWLASASNEGDPPQTMTTFAICASSGSYRYVKGPLKDLPDGTRRFAKAPCPGGTKVTGGGVHVTGANPDTDVHSTSPFDGPDADTTANDAWQVGENNNSGKLQHMTAFAVCAKSGSFKRPEGVTSIPLYSQASKRVACPAGTTVVGGGAFIFTPPDDTQTFLASTEPFDGPDADSRRDDGWLASATNETDTDAPMFVYAICAA